MIIIITNLESLKVSKIKKLIIHCSATPNGRAHTAEDIHRWHLERGWDGIGYHYVIRVNGKLENGRPEYWTGAHASMHNKESIGVCLIGTDEFSPEQFETLENLVREKMIEYDGIKVIGHNEVSNKSCPGFNVQWWLKSRNI